MKSYKLFFALFSFLFIFFSPHVFAISKTTCPGVPVSITLSWSSANVTSCGMSSSGSPGCDASSFDGNGGTGLNVYGGGSCSASISCTGPGGNASANDSVSVTEVNSSSCCNTGSQVGLTVWNGSTCVAPGPTPCPAWSGTLTSGACSYSGSVGSTAVGGSYSIPISGPAGYTGSWSYSCNDVGGTGTWTAGSATCDAPTPQAGVCSGSHYSCNVGSSASNGSSGGYWTWSCNGIYGGSNATGCSEVQPCGNGSINPPTCTPKPTGVTLSVADTHVSYGDSTTLSWSSSAATGCTATNAWSGAKATSGAGASTGSLTSNKTYGLYCSNAGGDTSATSVTVLVCPVGTPTWSGTACVNITGTISSSASFCTMAVGTNSCNVNLTWSTTNPIGTSAVTRNLPAGTVFTANNGTAQSTSVSGLYATVRYYLYNSATELDHVDVSPRCSNGLYWDTTSSSCAACAHGGCTGTGGSVGTPTGSLTCTNGANNVPACDQCPAPQAWDTTTSSCVPCTNGGCSGGPGGSISNPSGGLSCVNGASDVPTCSPKPNPTITLDGSTNLSISNYAYRPTIVWTAGSNNVTYPYSSCIAGGPWGGTFPPYSGTGLSNALSTGGTFNYTYSCTNPGGTTMAVAQVTVCPIATPVLTASGCQAVPVASLSWVTGNYTALGKMRITCANADFYALKRDGVTVAGESGATGGNSFTKIANVSVVGSYSLVCSYAGLDGHTFTANNAVNLVYQNTPPEPVVSLSATPASIAKGSSFVLSWTVMFPNSIQVPARASCTLTAKPICTNGVCTTAQNDASTTVNTLLRTGQTDANDPAGQRLISTAVNTLSNLSNPDDWRATGKKTIDLEKSMDFFLRCGAGIHASSSVEVLVTSRNEG